jgi:hypothetical protein
MLLQKLPKNEVLLTVFYLLSKEKVLIVIHYANIFHTKMLTKCIPSISLLRAYVIASDIFTVIYKKTGYLMVVLHFIFASATHTKSFCSYTI